MVKASLPSNPEAARLYAKAYKDCACLMLSLLSTYYRSGCTDPNHAPTYSALAAAWSTLVTRAERKSRPSVP